MAYVCIENDEITGVFSGPQNDPAPPGYAVIADDDPRLAAFAASRLAAATAGALRAQALAALAESDRTILRCVEVAAAIPPAWTAYRDALRAVAAGASDAIPARPDYPAGT